MIAVQTNDKVEVICYCRCLDQEALNVFHAAVTSTGGVMTYQDLAREIGAVAGPFYKALLNNHAVFEGVSCQKVNPGNVGVKQYDTASTGAGTGGTDLLPRQVCGIWTKLTEAAGRSNRGRVYVPFPPTAALIGGAEDGPDLGYIGDLTNHATYFTGEEIVDDGEGNTATLLWGIWSSPAADIKPTPDFRVNAKWATQRRRGDYGRTNPSVL